MSGQNSEASNDEIDTNDTLKYAERTLVITDAVVAMGRVLFPELISPMSKVPCRTSRLQGQDWVSELLHGHETRMYEQIRMNKNVFHLLCNILDSNGYLSEYSRRHIGVEESVAMFLTIICQHHTQRDSAERFQHSTETVHRHVRECGRAIAALAPKLICPPDLTIVAPEIEGNNRWYPYFKDAVGAIDGTIVPAWVPRNEQSAHRTRTGELAQNIIAACAFDLSFTFVVAGWEGSAHDSRIFLDTLRRPEFKFPWPPIGKYYLVDAGFSNFPGFLAPYRNARYNIKEFAGAGRGPTNEVELFNRMHSSIRNHIERCFGILKKRFAFMKGPMNNYPYPAQVNIIMACFVLHNFIRKHAESDEIFSEFSETDAVGVDMDDQDNVVPDVSPPPPRVAELDNDAMSAQSDLRDQIAHDLWNSLGS